MATMIGGNTGQRARVPGTPGGLDPARSGQGGSMLGGPSYAANMLVVAAVLVLAALGIWLYCLFEVLSTDEGDTRHLPKFAWFMIVLLGFDLGAIAWLVLGRRRGFVTADVTAWPPDYLLSGKGGRQETGPPAPMGPDDDPEFLRHLDRRLRGDD